MHRRKKLRAAVHRQTHQVVDGQAGHFVQLRFVPCDILRTITHARLEHGIGVLLVADPPQQGIRLQAAAFAGCARRVRAIARQQHADVHLVRLALQPVEIMLHAIPDAGPGFFPAHKFRFAVDDPAFLRDAQIPPRLVERDAALLCVLDKIVLAFLEACRLPRLHRAAAQGLRFIRNHQAIVDADDAAETTAHVARTNRRVERERALAGFAIVDVAVGAMKI